MHRLKIFGLAIVLAFPTLAFAQEEEIKEEWVIPYALVGALIGLGLFGICRPNRRSKKVEAVEE